MEKPGMLQRIQSFIQENFFTIIIYLVLTLIVIIAASLFIPINVDEVPQTEIELDRYSAAVDQRTILIRSLSYIVSGISVIIAFVSLIQSKNDQKTRERMQVMPFPVYSVDKESLDEIMTVSSVLKLREEKKYADHVIQGDYAILIRNIGLGSLVNFHVRSAYYEAPNGNKEEVTAYFDSSFILGKEVTNRLLVNVDVNYPESLSKSLSTDEGYVDTLSIVVGFHDLLGHYYEQTFTVEANVDLVGPQELTLPDGSAKVRQLYALKPNKITHTHPTER